MSADATAPWLNPLLTTLQWLQQAALGVWQALGLTHDVHGQAAWPWAWRIADDTLRLDLGLARQVALTLAMLGVIALLLALAALWRRRRGSVLAAAVLCAAITPWPPLNLVLAEAHPTSFHASPTHFAAESIVRGRAVYAEQRCARCHGNDGRGEGPLAASLPMWPPDLSRGLLWQRSDGELFWRIRHGQVDRQGRSTMPPADASLTDADAWALIDYLQALAAGQSLVRTGAWSSPVRMPRLASGCDAPSEARGQRLRVVVTTTGGIAPRPDPRFSDCATTSAADREALALIAGTGTETLVGAQFLVDRGGWLRALGRPSQAEWRDADMVCRSGDAAAAPNPAPGANSLNRLIARMDAEPIRAVRGGSVH